MGRKITIDLDTQEVFEHGEDVGSVIDIRLAPYEPVPIYTMGHESPVEFQSMSNYTEIITTTIIISRDNSKKEESQKVKGRFEDICLD